MGGLSKQVSVLQSAETELLHLCDLRPGVYHSPYSLFYFSPEVSKINRSGQKLEIHSKMFY